MTKEPSEGGKNETTTEDPSGSENSGRVYTRIVLSIIDWFWGRLFVKKGGRLLGDVAGGFEITIEKT